MSTDELPRRPKRLQRLEAAKASSPAAALGVGESALIAFSSLVKSSFPQATTVVLGDAVVVSADKGGGTRRQEGVDALEPVIRYKRDRLLAIKADSPSASRRNRGVIKASPDVLAPAAVPLGRTPQPPPSSSMSREASLDYSFLDMGDVHELLDKAPREAPLAASAKKRRPAADLTSPRSLASPRSEADTELPPPDPPAADEAEQLPFKVNRLLLSGNNIADIFPLPRVLDKVIVGGVSMLVSLNLSQNLLRALPSNLEEYVSLKILNLQANKIDSVHEMLKLAALPSLTTLITSGNPVEEQAGYKQRLMVSLQKLKTFDSVLITKHDRSKLTSRYLPPLPHSGLSSSKLRTTELRALSLPNQPRQ